MSLLDENLDSILNISDKDLLADICIKYFEKYGELGVSQPGSTTPVKYYACCSEFKLTSKYLYKNKYKQYKEIINNPEKFILCLKYNFDLKEKRLLILNKNDLNKNNTVSVCWFYFDCYGDNRSEFATIDKILNIMS